MDIVVGDKVKICIDSEYYKYPTSSNPRDKIGTVTKVCHGDHSYNDPHPITVQWSTHFDNVYRVTDVTKDFLWE